MVGLGHFVARYLCLAHLVFQVVLKLHLRMAADFFLDQVAEVVVGVAVVLIDWQAVVLNVAAAFWLIVWLVVFLMGVYQVMRRIKGKGLGQFALLRLGDSAEWIVAIVSSAVAQVVDTGEFTGFVVTIVTLDGDRVFAGLMLLVEAWGGSVLILQQQTRRKSPDKNQSALQDQDAAAPSLN